MVRNVGLDEIPPYFKKLVDYTSLQLIIENNQHLYIIRYTHQKKILIFFNFFF